MSAMCDGKLFHSQTALAKTDFRYICSWLIMLKFEMVVLLWYAEGQVLVDNGMEWAGGGELFYIMCMVSLVFLFNLLTVRFSDMHVLMCWKCILQTNHPTCTHKTILNIDTGTWTCLNVGLKIIIRNICPGFYTVKYDIHILVGTENYHKLAI